MITKDQLFQFGEDPAPRGRRRQQSPIQQAPPIRPLTVSRAPEPERSIVVGPVRLSPVDRPATADSPRPPRFEHSRVVDSPRHSAGQDISGQPVTRADESEHSHSARIRWTMEGGFEIVRENGEHQPPLDCEPKTYEPTTIAYVSPHAEAGHTRSTSGSFRYWPYAAVLALVAALVPIGKVVVSGKSKTPSVSVVEARSGGTEAQVMAEGAIVPGDVSNVSVLPQVDARVVRVFVRQGARVKRGDLLAELDPLNQAAQLREAEFGVQSAEAQMGLTRSPHRTEEIQQAREAVRSAQAKLELVKTPFRPEKLEQMELQVQADKQAVDEAEARLDLLRRGSRPQEIQRAQEAVASARAKLTPLQNEHQRNVTLHAKDLLSDAELERSAGEVSVAKSALTQAEEALSLVKEGARPEEIRIATAALERAKLTWQAHIQEVNGLKLGPRSEEVVQATADLKRAQLALQVMLRGARPDELRQAQARVGQSRALANRQREMLEQRFVRAPIAGVVIARNVNPGEIASRGEPRTDGIAPLTNNTRSMFIIADDTTVEFQANVDQRFYHSVKVGDPAIVSVEALPGRSFPGHVTRMNPLIIHDSAGTKKGDPSAPLTFSVWVRVANPNKRLVSGQAGLMRLTRRQQGLLIPQAALANFTLGEGLVYVEKDGVITARPVRYDDNTDGYVRVLSGLEEGDRVVVSKLLDLKSGMKVTATLESDD